MASKDQDHAAVSRKAATAKPTNVGGGDVGRTLMNPQWNFHEPKPTTLQIYTAAGGRWAKAECSEWAGGPGDESGDVTHTRAKRWGSAGGKGGWCCVARTSKEAETSSSFCTLRQWQGATEPGNEDADNVTNQQTTVEKVCQALQFNCGIKLNAFCGSSMRQCNVLSVRKVCEYFAGKNFISFT